MDGFARALGTAGRRTLQDKMAQEAVNNWFVKAQLLDTRPLAPGIESDERAKALFQRRGGARGEDSSQ